MKLQQIARSVYIPLLVVLMLFSRPMFCSLQTSSAAALLAGASAGAAFAYYYVWRPLAAAAKEVNETTVKVEALNTKANEMQATQAKHTEKLDAIERTQQAHTESLNAVKNHCEGLWGDLKKLKELTTNGITKLEKGQQDLKNGQKIIKTAIDESAQQQGVKIDAVKQDTSDIKKKLDAQNRQAQASGAPAQKSTSTDQYQSLFSTTEAA